MRSEPDAAPPASVNAGDMLVALARQLKHDLNNAFAVMIGNLRLLRTGAQDLPREELAQALADAENAGREATALAGSVLCLMGSMDTRPHGLQDLAPILAGAERSIRQVLRQKIGFATGGISSPRLVRVDPAVLEAMLVALALTAQKDLGRRGRISLTVADADPGQIARQSAKRPAESSIQVIVAGEPAEVPGVPGPGSAVTQETGDPLLALIHQLCRNWGGKLTTEAGSGKKWAIINLPSGSA